MSAHPLALARLLPVFDVDLLDARLIRESLTNFNDLILGRFKLEDDQSVDGVAATHSWTPSQMRR